MNSVILTTWTQHLLGLKMEAYSAPVWGGQENQFQSHPHVPPCLFIYYIYFEIYKYADMQPLSGLCVQTEVRCLDVKHYCCKCSLRICGMLFVVWMIRWIYLIKNCFSNYKCVEMVVFFGQRIFLQLNYQIWSVKKLFVWIPLQTNMCKGKNQMLELSATSGRRDRSAVSAEVTFHRD